MSCLIDVSNRQTVLAVDPARIEQAVRTVLAGERVTHAEIQVAVVDNQEIHKVNRRFLQHDCATDVISFPLSEEGGPLEGDVMVSAQMAQQVGPRYGWPAQDELLLYVIHGTLHLVGYDDVRDEDRMVMRQRETHYLATLGLDVTHRVNVADADPHAAQPTGGEST